MSHISSQYSHRGLSSDEEDDNDFLGTFASLDMDSNSGPFQRKRFPTLNKNYSHHGHINTLSKPQGLVDDMVIDRSRPMGSTTIPQSTTLNHDKLINTQHYPPLPPTTSKNIQTLNHNNTNNNNNTNNDERNASSRLSSNEKQLPSQHQQPQHPASLTPTLAPATLTTQSKTSILTNRTPSLDPTTPLNSSNNISSLQLIPNMDLINTNTALHSPHDDSVLDFRSNAQSILRNNNNNTNTRNTPTISSILSRDKGTGAKKQPKHVSISNYSSVLETIPSPTSPLDHDSNDPTAPPQPLLDRLKSPEIIFTKHCNHAQKTCSHNLDNPDSQHSYASSIASSSGYTYNSAYSSATTMLSLSHFGKFIGSAFHAPPWYSMRYITTGFRINYNFADSWKSLFELHNETAGIWSHIFGFFIFIYLFIYRYNTVLYAIEDRFLFWCYVTYYIGSAICMLCSFTFHLFCCCSQYHHDTLYGLDMSAINVMIIGNIMHPVYMMWYCDPNNIGVWYAMYALIFGLILVGVQNNQYLLQEKFFMYRIGAIIFYGASALIPFFHFAPVGREDQVEMVIRPIIITFTAYGIGVLIWIFKLPECLAPGVFDLGLYSHGLWHSAIIIGSLTTETYFQYVLERIVDNTWCEAPTIANAMIETATTAATAGIIP